jgi:hypothetical protein
MKILVFFIVLIALCFSSCKNQKSSLIQYDVYYDILYKGEDNFKQFYIVDTIVIKEPIIIRSQQYGGPFIIEKEKLNNYQNSIEFLLSPDIFILGFDLYRDLEFSDYKKISYSAKGGCVIQESEIKMNGIEIREYESDPKFILGLINTNYYHVKHNSESYFNIPIKDSKITYIKIVYPLCE